MKDSYNVLELKFNGNMEDVKLKLQTFLEENNFKVSGKNNSRYWGSLNNGLVGKYHWEFYVKDNSLYLVSTDIYDSKFYAHNYKIFENDFSNMEFNNQNLEQLSLDEVSKATVKAMEVFINYFKNNNFEFSYNEGVLSSNQFVDFVRDKELIRGAKKPINLKLILVLGVLLVIGISNNKYLFVSIGIILIIVIMKLIKFILGLTIKDENKAMEVYSKVVKYLPFGLVFIFFGILMFLFLR